MCEIGIGTLEISEGVLINRKCVQEWCRGDRLPPTWRLPRLCALLNCSADWLLGISP